MFNNIFNLNARPSYYVFSENPVLRDLILYVACNKQKRHTKHTDKNEEQEFVYVKNHY